MRRIFFLSLLCALMSAAVPAVVYSRGQIPSTAEPGPSPAAEARRMISLLRDGRIETMPLEEYLPGVVAGEMPAVFPPQALRAQAVASRTYALHRMQERSSRHPEADVCDDSDCCQVWLDESRRRELWGENHDLYESAVHAAVADTAGAILTWGGEPILACFHASSPGRTESSGALWGTALPYLVSVDTPESADDVPNFITTAELTPETFRQGVLSVVPSAPFSGEPETWIGERVLDTGGRVAAIRVGGATVPGAALRKAFSLRSCCFTLEWTGESFLFTVEGSGHGAGMSQYGARVLAESGASWQEILAHYYPGAQVELLSP